MTCHNDKIWFNDMLFIIFKKFNGSLNLILTISSGCKSYVDILAIYTNLHLKQNIRSTDWDHNPKFSGDSFYNR